MRLNHNDKRAFVRAVMADVPQVDYHEQIDAAVRAFAAKRIPLGLEKFYAKSPEIFSSPSVYLEDVGENINWPVAAGNCPLKDITKLVKPLFEANDKQTAELRAAQRKLELSILGMRTRGSVVKNFPELEKYLPAAPQAADRSLPVASSVVTDLLKLGWPKGKKK